MLKAALGVKSLPKTKLSGAQFKKAQEYFVKQGYDQESSGAIVAKAFRLATSHHPSGGEV